MYMYIYMSFFSSNTNSTGNSDIVNFTEKIAELETAVINNNKVTSEFIQNLRKKVTNIKLNIDALKDKYDELNKNTQQQKQTLDQLSENEITTNDKEVQLNDLTNKPNTSSSDKNKIDDLVKQIDVLKNEKEKIISDLNNLNNRVQKIINDIKNTTEIISKYDIIGEFKKIQDQFDNFGEKKTGSFFGGRKTRRRNPKIGKKQMGGYISNIKSHKYTSNRSNQPKFSKHSKYYSKSKTLSLFMK